MPMEMKEDCNWLTINVDVPAQKTPDMCWIVRGADDGLTDVWWDEQNEVVRVSLNDFALSVDRWVTCEQWNQGKWFESAWVREWVFAALARKVNKHILATMMEYAQRAGVREGQAVQSKKMRELIGA